MEITSNLKGHIALTKTLTRALELGYTPIIPSFDTRYDLILDNSEKLIKVQVKYANGKSTRSTGSVRVKLSYETRTKKIYTYQTDEVDALVVYLPKVDRLCMIPSQLFVGKVALNIRLEKPKNNQKNKIIFADDYFW